jgi:hypothetical protein
VNQSNIISGNAQNGIQISGTGANNNLVAGNVIGADVNGATAIANGQNGVFIYQGNNNTVGAATNPQQGANRASNIISGNRYYGVEIAGSNNLLVNNYIGTDNSGLNSIANYNGGINIGYSSIVDLGVPANVTATNNTVGGTAGVNSTLNVISGNGPQNAQGLTNLGYGISMAGGGVQGILIEGNYIGVGVDGITALGNHNSGVAILVGNTGEYPTNTTIGGAAAGAGNVISANGFIGSGGTAWGYGVEADGGSGLLQNNNIGFDVNGEDLSGKGALKNKAGEVSLSGTWTSKGNLQQ